MAAWVLVPGNVHVAAAHIGDAQDHYAYQLVDPRPRDLVSGAVEGISLLSSSGAIVSPCVAAGWLAGCQGGVNIFHWFMVLVVIIGRFGFGRSSPSWFFYRQECDRDCFDRSLYSSL